MSQESRIVDLEVRVAYQDKHIEELDEVIREFSTRVERLEAFVKDLRESANAAPIGPPNDPPPHY
jgi:uncharacterized coiled-coil protein SlyX